MKKFNKNPRKITTSSKDKLQASLTDLGDLSGIVHNRKTDEIVGGNQRMAIFGNDYEIVIDHQNDLPDEQGTVAIGRIVWEGNSYAYRLVDWDEETAKKANLAANISAGTWDYRILSTEWTPDEISMVFDDELIDNMKIDIEAISAIMSIDIEIDETESVDDVKFKEYGEDIADDVAIMTCPHCGEQFPK